MTSTPDNVAMLKAFLQELEEKDESLKRNRRYPESAMWLSTWKLKVNRYILQAYGKEESALFLGPPSLGTSQFRDQRIWKAYTKRHRDFLKVLIQQEEDSLAKTVSTHSTENRYEVLARHLESWKALLTSGELDMVYVQKFHEQSIRGLSPYLSTSDIATLKKLNPKYFEDKFTEGLDSSSISMITPYSECVKGWVAELGFIKLRWFEAERTIVNRSEEIEEPGSNKRVFIIHGHDETNLLKLEKLIRKLELEPVVMKDERTAGLTTFLDKFEGLAKTCSFAVALITKDDLVVKNEVQTWQGRPNAMFEIGWFCKHFNRKGIILIVQSGAAVWSDLQGVEYVSFETDVNSVYEFLHQTFKAIGLTK